ncbi:MAG: PEP-CTERM sorting domain-containing protein [Leptolyngbyaceae cyanobacterium CSU_1_3]|nr:PEP-CTERM sorting domain-containing protein [Leptolyngbyaceae cyanobacterium CSU_1_3]
MGPNDGVTKPPRFTRGEANSFNPGRAMTRYELSILGDSYNLFANRNYQAPILSGKLRDYSPEGLFYSNPNALFFGDNTTSARASVKIARIDLSNTAIAFKPALLAPAMARTAASIADGSAEIKFQNADMKTVEVRQTEGASAGVQSYKVQRAETPRLKVQRGAGDELRRKIPEPSVLVGLIGLSGCLLGRRRRELSPQTVNSANPPS